jgi:hypothetical protein
MLADMPTSRPTRRDAFRYLMGSITLPVFAACQATPARAPTPTNPLVKPRATPGADVRPVLASTELALGQNRFALGLIDARNQPITNGTVHLEFFKVSAQNDTAQKRSEADAVFRAVELMNKGIWVSYVNFDEVGEWGAQVTVDRPGEPTRTSRLPFQVREKFSAPGYGEPAPRSDSPTVRDVSGDPSRICSNAPPCELHGLSISEALAPADKPLVVLFATPALCSSAICAPELEAVLKLRASSYAERANFVHVEIYEYPFETQKLVKTVQEWRLPSEPWVFIVDRGGIVRDRFEGAAPAEELEPALKPHV